MSAERRALALISLGEAETWTFRNEEAERHLEQGVALARQIGRPYLELTGLCYLTQIAVLHSFTLGAQRCMEAIELAGRHGWGKQPITGVAYVQLAGAMVGQGRLEDAERWLEVAERALRVEIEPIAGITLHWMRGALQLSRGCPERALDAFPGPSGWPKDCTPHWYPLRGCDHMRYRSSCGWARPNASKPPWPR